MVGVCRQLSFQLTYQTTPVAAALIAGTATATSSIQNVAKVMDPDTLKAVAAWATAGGPGGVQLLPTWALTPPPAAPDMPTAPSRRGPGSAGTAQLEGSSPSTKAQKSPITAPPAFATGGAPGWEQDEGMAPLILRWPNSEVTTTYPRRLLPLPPKAPPQPPQNPAKPRGEQQLAPRAPKRRKARVKAPWPKQAS